MSNFTDVQLNLFTPHEQVRQLRRNTPIDGNPYDWQAQHSIIQLKTIGRTYYVWNPCEPTIWTEDITGAYRYSESKTGRFVSESDLQHAKRSALEKGVDGTFTIESRNKY